MNKNILLYGLIILALAISLFRFFLPDILQGFVESKLNQIPDYKAHIGSISINLYRGSYTINDIQLVKTKKNIPVPFFSANSVEFTIEWLPLVHGHLVAKVTSIHPILNFVIDPQGKNEQLTIDDQWRAVVTKLFPLPFNRIVIHQGEVYFRSFTSKPPFEVHIKNIESTLTNLRKVEKTRGLLFSTLQAEGTTMDGAKTTMTLQLNPFLMQPTFLLKASVDSMKISAANNLLQHYTKIKVNSGLFSLYIEAAAAKGKITGYVKPLFKNLNITSPNSKTDNPIEYLYKGAANLIASILENPKHKTVATKIKIYGDISHPDTNLFSIIGYLLRHAFIQALLPGIDSSVKMEDVIISHT